MQSNTWQDDTSFTTDRLTGFRRGETHTELEHDGCVFAASNAEIDAAGVALRVGSEVRCYGRGFGYPVRGLVIDGVMVFYRTEDQEQARHEQWVADQKAKRIADYEARRSEYDARIAALPETFRTRLHGFAAKNPEFGPEYLPYELFVCEEAVKIARACDTEAEVQRFAGLPYPEQKARVPDLGEGHSGNTFGAACYLARLWLHEADLVPKAHGAIVPLVGCDAFGCHSVPHV